MRIKFQLLTIAAGLCVTTGLVPAAPERTSANVARAEENAVLWQDPGDIAARDLFYGQGGKAHEPSGTFTFVKEDLDHSNPKFVVRDEKGVEWKVKLGPETSSETAASRLVWAVGYFTDEDYIVPNLRVANMPRRLRRGQKFVGKDGSMDNARLERQLKTGQKAIWKWRDNAFTKTREMNGLRVMMALVNNWDLKDVNNSIYSMGEGKFLVVSDLGASFGSPGFTFPMKKTRSNLEAYRRSAFVTEMEPEEVSFRSPARPALIRIFALPDFISRLGMRSIGRDIPREHAKWIGQILSRLTAEQIRSAFRAGGYSASDVEGFAKVVEARIAQLNEL